MNEAALQHESPHRRILVLSGQAFALGLTIAWITIPASAIFLQAYGSELLPVTYIGAAVAGVVSSTLLSAAFRKRSLASVATRVLAGLAVALLASWAVLARWEADWVSFALLVLIPIVVPVGFIFVVGQAGMLLDVRSLKALYARVVAGFALGFVAGGLTGAPLLNLLGSTESLLAAAAVAAGLFLGLVMETKRRYPAELAQVTEAEAEPAPVTAERPTLRGLARHRYVMLIVAFQMLSAVESQWLDFLVLSSAAQRYADTNELARFISQFSAIAYGTDIVFLLLLAGLLLHRFGLRYGLTANSIAVLSVLAAIIVATSVIGSTTTIVFVLIVAARVADLTFSDGAARTSLSAAYQAVPNRLRAVAQATVEGLAVPVAIGFSGVVLLVLQSADGTDGLVLPILTSVVVLAWVVVAVLVYREYRVNLLANLRGRTLRPADLTVDDESSLIVIDRLVESGEERDVRLGLDILTIAQHPGLPARLERLVVDQRVSVRTDALERLVQVAPQMAATAARRGLDDPSPEVRSASLRVLGAGRDPADLAAIARCSNDSVPEVRVAAASALTRVGDDDARAKVTTEIAVLARSETITDRAVAALMLGEVEPGSWLDRRTLHALIADPDPNVVNAALASLRWPEDVELLPQVANYVDQRETAGAALEALVRAGDAALAVIDDRLRVDEDSRHAQEQLVRASRDIGTPLAVATLRTHLDHRDREVGLAVMRALAALGSWSPGSNPDRPDLTAPIVRTDLEHATRILRALVAFENDALALLLSSALRDELDLVGQRVLAAFSMRHGTGFNRVVFQLAQRDSRSHALALEWLDVTLTGTDRAAVALLEPRLSNRERLSALSRTFPAAPLSQGELLLDLVTDRDDLWRRPWLAACAIYTASCRSQAELDLVAAAVTTGSLGTDEAGITAETLTGIRHRRRLPLHPA